MGQRLGKSIESAKALGSALTSAKQTRDAIASSNGPQAASGSTTDGSLDPRAVGQALAELMKQNNTLTQSIAVRVSTLATKYPNKAY